MYNKRTTVLVTGGFDPVHSGHINLFNEATKLGDRLIVGLNSDKWLTRKKGKFFMGIDERKCIISHLKMINKVIEFNDDDNTAILAIKKIMEEAASNEFIIFANGGDRVITNTPELEYFKNEERINFIFGVGGNQKKNSSGLLLNKWSNG